MKKFASFILILGIGFFAFDVYLHTFSSREFQRRIFDGIPVKIVKYYADHVLAQGDSVTRGVDRRKALIWWLDTNKEAALAVIDDEELLVPYFDGEMESLYKNTAYVEPLPMMTSRLYVHIKREKHAKLDCPDLNRIAASRICAASDNQSLWCSCVDYTSRPLGTDQP